MSQDILDFEKGWSKMIADLKEPKTFDTIGGRSRFTIQCINDRIEFLSPYKGCVISKSVFREVYQRFVKIRSWSTTDYHYTRHASYLLRLLKEYFI